MNEKIMALKRMDTNYYKDLVLFLNSLKILLKNVNSET